MLRYILHLGGRITRQFTELTEQNDPLTLDSLVYLSEQSYRCLNAYGECDNADAVAEGVTLLLLHRMNLMIVGEILTLVL